MLDRPGDHMGLTKAQGRKRLLEARKKVLMVFFDADKFNLSKREQDKMVDICNQLDSLSRKLK